MSRSALRIALLAVALGTEVGATQPCASWQWLNPLPTGQPLAAVTFNGEGYVAVGGFGTIVGSSDGVSWATRSSGTRAALYGVASSGNGYIAVGASGEALTSSDGRTWTTQTTGTSETLRAVAWTGHEFIAVGDASTMIWTQDGTHWTLLHSQAQYRLNGVTSDGTVVVVVGEAGGAGPSGLDNGYAFIAVRGGSGAWTATPLPSAGALAAVTWAGTQFVAVGRHGTVLTSADGSTWTARSAGTSEAILSVAWNGMELAAITEFGLVLTSADGQAWTARSLGEAPAPFVLAPHGVAWGRNEWAVVGGLWDASAVILTSRDAIEWTSHTSGVVAAFADVVWTGDRFVAAAGPQVVMGSGDGATWIAHDVGVQSGIYSLAWNGALFVGVGNDSIVTSPDGLNWTLRVSDPDGFLMHVIWAAGRFVAVGGQPAGEYGLILTSVDGVTWSRRVVQGIELIGGVAWNGRRLVAVGWDYQRSYGMSLTSDDGVHWSSPAPIAFSSYLSSVAWGNGRFVAVGGGTVNVSPDGYGWQNVGPADQALFLDDVGWVGTRFVAVGSEGRIVSSPDGRTWAIEDSGTNKWLSSVAASPWALIATGGGGTVLRSGCGGLRVRRHLLAVTPEGNVSLEPSGPQPRH